MPNQSARNVQLTVGGKDFTPCLISFQGSDSHLDPSGLISFTGTIVLGKAIDFDESLDDRKNPTRFCRGTVVTLAIADSTNTLQRHPRGALRILAPKYDDEKQQLTLDVGDLIALLKFKEPIDSVAFDRFLVAGLSDTGDGSTTYKDPILDYVAGYDRPLSMLITTLLSRAGINGYSGGVPGIIYNNALNLSGSYLDSVGKLLYANNLFGWIDKNESFHIAPANISGGIPAISLTIGIDEIWYKRLDGSESPCEVVNATGTGIYVYPATFLDDVDELYASAKTVDKTASENVIIVVQRTTKTQRWNKALHILTIQTIIEKPAGLVFPVALQDSSTSKIELVVAEIQVEVFNYEMKLACKLKQKTTSIYQPRGTYFAEYKAAHPSVIANLYTVVQTKAITETYQYDVKDRLQQISYSTQELAIAILNSTNEDWTVWLEPPEYLVNSELKTERYKELSKGVWDYRTTDFQCVVRVNTDLVSGPNNVTSGPNTNKLDLIAATTGNEDKRSNSGQNLPPAPERCPADVRYEEVNLKAKAQFADPCPTVLRQRERTYTVDYLAGQTVNASVSNPSILLLPFGGGGSVAQNQLQAIAIREGRLLWGRYKGQEIAVPMRNEIFNYTPLLDISATETDGTVQNYLVDGASWVVSPTKALWSCDGIWVGTTVSGQIIPPYTEPQEIGVGGGAGIDFGSYPYPLIVVSEAIASGSGGGIQFTGTGITYWENATWDEINNSTWDSLYSSFTTTAASDWDDADWDNVNWDNI